jgi:SRSO17 transposase
VSFVKDFIRFFFTRGDGNTAEIKAYVFGLTQTIRLYLPKACCDDPWRCDKAGILEDQRHFLTKPQLALESVRHQRQRGIGFDLVGMDSGYGSDHGFLHALDRSGETFVAEVHCDQIIWTEAPWPPRQRTPSSRPEPSGRAG